MAINDEFERVLGPYKSVKHQFVYQDGYPLREDRLVYLVYTKDKIEMFVDVDTQPIFAKNPSDKTLFSKYKEAKGNLQREVYLKPSQPIITNTMRKKNSIGRSFAKYLLDVDKSIIEIDTGLVGSSDVYTYVSLQWEISGIKENVQKKNTESLEVAEEEMEGMRYYLDPLEFYIGEETLESKKQTLLERLLHNPHTYGHQSDASNVGSALGLSGTHTMPDGSVMPGATHQQYLNSLRRNNQITTSSGTSIPTRNLRRNSGY
jgi:hypothetical protein